MSAESHYKSNLRDLQFNLFEFHDLGQRVLGRAPFTLLDEAAARQTIEQMEKLAVSELASSFTDADRQPPVLGPDGEVRLSEAIKKTVRAYLDNDWHLLEMPEYLGGMAAPPSLGWANFELLIGANPAVAFYVTSVFMGRVIDRFATPEQKQRFLPQMVQKGWGCTMVLTEPDAGSDVGAGRTRARHIQGDEWHIEGVKRFITAAEYDTSDNIVHLVLARPEGAGPGTKGLSLFIVPKRWVQADGTLGERNGVRVTNVEHKMGLRGSATCELTFGEDTPARGLLLGNDHSGIHQMFHIIEQARMAIGIKSMSTLSTAYHHALGYARERIQGPDLMQAMDKASPRVAIIRHPDVRRMLMMQKSHAEGMRALCFFAAAVQDEVALLGGHGAKSAAELDRLNDLLLPLIKGYCSEKAYELLALSLQCFGGSGYLQDYPIEQYIRDQKIDSLYEGTTHIQALDLLLRKIGRDGGHTLRGLLAQIHKTLNEAEGGETLTVERALLKEALSHLEAMLMALVGKLSESLYHAGLQGNRLLMALAEVCVGWLLVRHAALAARKLNELGNKGDKDGAPTDTAGDAAFYAGKIASARFFCAEVLPRLATDRRLVEGSTLALMQLPDAVFGP
ncbi:MAG TPA: acyl-CoA dehydrogenase [Pseudomonadota bacterium]|nr:acyl-CoA dehydrogenase [Pseudomonadota bacterium]